MLSNDGACDSRYIMQNFDIFFINSGPAIKRITWNMTSELSFTSGITYLEKDNAVVIHRAGLYFVYSRFVFEHKISSSHNKKTPQHLYYHKIHHHNPGAKPGSTASTRIILKSKVTPCDSDAEGQDISSYIGGVFELNNGSSLFVQVYYTNKLKAVPHLNYFGVHLM